MRIIDIYRDFGIEHLTEEARHRHATAGWVNVHCPFCAGSQDYHLGFNLDDHFFRCWRCGHHWPDESLKALLGVSTSEAQQIIKQYGGTSTGPIKDSKPKVNLHKFKYPTQMGPLRPPHRKYLENRGYDPDYLADKWGVQGTGPVSSLDKISYAKRIVAPIQWEGKDATFQARALYDSMQPKYLACPMAREVHHHQHILYGRPLHWKRRGVCVEGTFDVWRLGPQSFAIFGIDFTPEQVRTMSKFFDEIVILFDPGRTEMRQARKLIKQLAGYGVKAWVEKLETDPGDMPQDDADHLMRGIMKGIF